MNKRISSRGRLPGLLLESFSGGFRLSFPIPSFTPPRFLQPFALHYQIHICVLLLLVPQSEFPLAEHIKMTGKLLRTLRGVVTPRNSTVGSEGWIDLLIDGDHLRGSRHLFIGLTHPSLD